MRKVKNYRKELTTAERIERLMKEIEQMEKDEWSPDIIGVYRSQLEGLQEQENEENG